MPDLAPFGQIAAGFLVNLKVLALAYPLAYALGLGLMVGATVLPRIVVVPLQTALLAVRITPMPVQLVVLYFGSVAYGLAMPPLAVAVSVFVLHYAAFFSEKFRSSYLAVGVQQTEAAYALALPRRTAATRIVVPQLALLTYPASVNAFLGMVKDSAVLSVIAITDAIQSAKNVGAISFDYVPAFTFAAGLFVAFYLVARAFGRRLEGLLGRRYGGLGV